MKTFVFKRKALTFIKLLYYRCLFQFYKKQGTPKVMSIEDTIKLVVEKKMSVARFGDSEYLYMVGNNDGLQTSSWELQKLLRKTIKNRNEKLLVCMVDYLDVLNRSWYSKLCSSKFYVQTYSKIKPYIFSDVIYGNSNMTRFYINYKDKSKSSYYFDLCKKIWENENIVIFEGKNTRFGVSNDLLDNAKSIKRVLCPSKEAFSFYDEIIKFAMTLDRSSLLFFALGVTATIAASDLTDLGYRVIDIGNLDVEYEWYKRGALRKIAIKGKQVSEVYGGTNVEEIDDDDYKHQIIYKIGC